MDGPDTTSWVMCMGMRQEPPNGPVLGYAGSRTGRWNVLASKYITRQAVAEFEDYDGTGLGIGKSSPRDPSLRGAL
jgi:hypothetical protein